MEREGEIETNGEGRERWGRGGGRGRERGGSERGWVEREGGVGEGERNIG